MLRGIESAALSENDFDAYLAARLLSTQELNALDFRDMIKIRNQVRSAILSSPSIHKELRSTVDDALAGIPKRGS